MSASKRYTEEQLYKMGMSKEQVNAILKTYADEEPDDKIVKFVDEDKESKACVGIAKPGEVVPVNCNEAMKITSAADLQSYASGTVVRLPDFGDGQPFVARMRRPSMLVLAKSGKIPNTLLSAASELFAKGGSGLDTDSDNMLGDMYDICHIICESALIAPTMEEIEGAGMELSDDQLMAIFNYTQTGVHALESFR